MRRLLLALALLPMMAILAPESGRAQGAFPPAVIGVVDMQGVLRQATAFQDINAQIDAIRKQYDTEAQTQQAELKQAEQDLLQQRSILSQEAFQQRRTEFQRQVQEFQRTIQLKRRQLEQGFQESTDQVRQVLIEVVAEVFKERGLSVVIDKGSYVIADTNLDISQEVLQRLNSRLTKVAVTLPDLSQVQQN